ncbi:HCLS1-associated protein X-1 [Diachasma alloeum]|uniref:HCLS1-associated protein X-1 n=1 Tax=Diachasma alloeum TaxID=454923 RepID=UPI00073841A8|nr:HCLS1-associated protein X-1 [Diachasma alloeum]
MPFLRSILESLFGGGDNHRTNPGDDDRRMFGDRFRNPIWQNDEEDDDEYGEDYRNPGHSRPAFHFEIFTNPFEMTRYFESQMDDMMKDFFSFGFSEDKQIPFEGFSQIMPPNHGKGDLREEVLKPGYALPPPRHGVDSPKCDEDLDGKVDPKDFSRVWNNGVTEPEEQLSTASTSLQPFKFRSFGQSIVSQTIRRPDGSIEEKRTTKDNEGNTETIIKHRMGDKTHTVVIKKDKNGVETQTENFENMDPNELNNFDKNWKPIEDPLIESGALTKFPWNKFFDFSPKL